MIRSALSAMLAVGLTACATPAPPTAAQPPIAIGQAAPATTAQIDAMVDDLMAELALPGLSIALIDDGEIVYARNSGLANTATGERITDGSIFEVASLSKPVFAYLALRMADRGLIDLDRALHEYLPLPELAHEPRYRTITGRMVLSHRTGFPGWRWFDLAPEEMGIERGTMYMKADPGTFTYSGEGYNWLARVLAQETGHTLLTLDRLFQREVAEPLALDHAAFVQTPYIADHKVIGHVDGEPVERGWPRSFPEDTPQTFGAAGRLHTDAAIYARFLVALMAGTGLSDDAHRAMFTDVTDVPRDHSMHRISGETGWTLGLAVKHGVGGRYFAHGGSNTDFKSGFAIDPATRDGFVFVANSDRGDRLGARLEQLYFGGPHRD